MQAMERTTMEFINRRSFIETSVAGIALFAVRDVFGQEGLTHELQRGDPQLTYEKLDYSKSHIDQLSSGGKGTLENAIPDFGAKLVEEIKKPDYLGKSRENAHDLIDSFLSMFGSAFEVGGQVVPFCAAGLSWVATTVYADQSHNPEKKNRNLQQFLLEVRQRHFYPTPSVVNMKLVASIEGKWVPRVSATGVHAPRKGWLVIFNWDGKRPDHVGIIDSVEAGWLNTVEFNTSDQDNRNGGTIAKRRRQINHTVEGYIRT
jgi:hypothetical protein